MSISVFSIAITQPAFYQTRTVEPVVESAICLVVGAMGLMAGYFEWIANPLLLYSWVAAYRGRRYQAGVCATVALVLIGSFLFRSTMEYPLTEQVGIVHIVKHGFGYWLWMISAAIMVVGFYGALINRKSPRDETASL